MSTLFRRNGGRSFHRGWKSLKTAPSCRIALGVSSRTLAIREICATASPRPATGIPSPSRSRSTINLTGALPDLTHSINIDGPGPGLMTVRRDTGGTYRILTVTGGTTVRISGLTIADGRVAALFAASRTRER